MSTSVKVILGIVGVLVVLGLWTSGSYNKLVTADEQVTSSWAQVENVYQRRADLIPNLVATVKGYAAHESETLTAVIEARAKATQVKISADSLSNPQAFEQFQKAQGGLSTALGKLMVVSEQYPDLKANENFLQLQVQLEGTENRITVERMRFNESAQAFNTLRRRFPTVIMANLMGMGEKAYFKADEGADKAPVVKF